MEVEGMAVPVVGLLAAMAGGAAAAGLWESANHRRVLNQIPLRVHVNGTRGKTSTTRVVAALLRELGHRTVAKCTGDEPLWIDPEGMERPWPRRGRVRVHEQMRFLRLAAGLGAEAAVVECMAVDPLLQWVCEHQFVRSHVGVITNVRRDHFEEMGCRVDDIARCLANTIPRRGVLVTGDPRFAPLFRRLAKPLGTRVVLAVPEGGASGPAAENRAVAEAAVRAAGFSETAVKEASARAFAYLTDGSGAAVPAGTAPETSGAAFALPAPFEGALLLDAWSVNDVDSFESFLALRVPAEAPWIALYNHRSDRPLRTLAFGRVFAEGLPGVGGSSGADGLPAHTRRRPPSLVLLTGDGGAERLMLRAGVSRERLARVAAPLGPETVAWAAAERILESAAPLPVVVGCGNARGLPASMRIRGGRR